MRTAPEKLGAVDGGLLFGWESGFSEKASGDSLGELVQRKVFRRRVGEMRCQAEGGETNNFFTVFPQVFI